MQVEWTTFNFLSNWCHMRYTVMHINQHMSQKRPSRKI